MSDAKLFDNPEALANAAALIEIRAATVGSRARRREFAEAQEERLRGSSYRIGPNGATVFKVGWS